MKYKEHDIVWKTGYAGYGAPAGYAMIIDDDEGDHMPCPLDCSEKDCMEWSTLWLIEAPSIRRARDMALTGKFSGTAHHVSECQLLPEKPPAC